MFDYVIVGCGLSGCVLAHKLANELNKKVLILDKRNHIGGNCYDYFNRAGILVHKYGPHYFRTNMKHVFEYLSTFTEWHYTYYRIKIMVEGRMVPLPINLDTVNELFGLRFNSEELCEYFDKQKCHVGKISNSEDVIISKVGRELYEKIYKPYTTKQWGLDPSYLDSSVCERIPIRTNRDDRYFTDKYQAMPKHGYHRMFQKMLLSPNIKIMLQTEFESIQPELTFRKLIFTGSIDEFFKCKFGTLPYRSLRFEHETLQREFYQPTSQVNYPSDYDFTRIVEIKHATGQIHPHTTIVREYPTSEGIPFYPIPNPGNEELYQKYRLEGEKMNDCCFIGRLAQYRYLNMDQVVDNALTMFEKIKQDESL